MGDWGTADNFRKAAAQTTKDLLIISSDIVTDYDLTNFIRFYREKDATLVCLFSSIPSIKEDMVPAKKLMDNSGYDIVGFNTTEENHLVYFEHDAKFSDTLTLKKGFLKHCPSIKFHANRQDAHIYIMKNWILKYLDRNRSVTSIKGDLVPSIVRKQFREHRFALNDPLHNEGTLVGDDLDPDHDPNDADYVFFKCLQRTNLENILSKFDLIRLKNIVEEEPPKVKNTMRCYGLVADTGVCIRTNNILRFCEANRVILRQFPTRNQKTDKIKSYVDGVIGTDTVIGEKCSISRTVIGSNCKISSNVVLQNCILLDKVQVHDGAVLKNCLICANSIIEAKSVLSGCIVGAHKKIEQGSQHDNEMLVDMEV